MILARLIDAGAEGRSPAPNFLWRRYSEFELLRSYLVVTYPFIVVPPLPEKRVSSDPSTVFLFLILLTKSEWHILPNAVGNRKARELNQCIWRTASEQCMCLCAGGVCVAQAVRWQHGPRLCGAPQGWTGELPAPCSLAPCPLQRQDPPPLPNRGTPLWGFLVVRTIFMGQLSDWILHSCPWQEHGWKEVVYETGFQAKVISCGASTSLFF